MGILINLIYKAGGMKQSYSYNWKRGKKQQSFILARLGERVNMFTFCLCLERIADRPFVLFHHGPRMFCETVYIPQEDTSTELLTPIMADHSCQGHFSLPHY